MSPLVKTLPKKRGVKTACKDCRHFVPTCNGYGNCTAPKVKEYPPNTVFKTKATHHVCEAMTW